MHSAVKGGHPVGSSTDEDRLSTLRREAERLQSGDRSSEAYRSACDAFMASLSEFESPGVRQSDVHNEFLTSLVLQEGCDVSPPILHHALASYLSSGVPASFRRAAGVLRPVIKRLMEKQTAEKNLTLLILLLRSQLKQE